MGRRRPLPDWANDLMKEFMRPPYFLEQLLKENPEYNQYNKSAGNTAQGVTSNEDKSADSHHQGHSAVSNHESDSERSHRGRHNGGGRQARSNDGPSSLGGASNTSGQDRPKNRRSAANGSKNAELAAFGAASRELNYGSPGNLTHLGPSANWQGIFKRSGFPVSLAKAYGWTIQRAEFQYDVMRVQTAKGTYALKHGHLVPDKVLFLHEAFQYLKQQGFTQFAPIAVAHSGKPYAVRNNKTYYASRWISGQPVNFASVNQVREVAHTLAEFHERSRGFEAESYTPPAEFKLDHLLRERMEDLKRLLGRAQISNEPDGFEKVLANHAAAIREDAERSVRLVESDQVLTFLRDDEETPGLCHLDVIPGNFIYTPENQVVAIDFDLCTYAPRALDLSHLLRRALQQQHWLTDVAYSCFVEYNRSRNITGSEYRLIEALIRFPYRIWRVAHSRYRFGEQDGQSDELESAIREWQRRELFLDSFSRQIQS